jgi:hypothetical protein
VGEQLFASEKELSSMEETTTISVRGYKMLRDEIRAEHFLIASLHG